MKRYLATCLLKGLILLNLTLLLDQKSYAQHLGNALNFDGTDDYVLTNSSNFTQYTFEAWIRLSSNSNKNIIVYSDNTGPSTAWSHQIKTDASGHFVHYFFDEDLGVQSVTGTSVASIGVWYHVAITAKNGGFARLYVNGVEEGTAVSTGTLWNGSKIYIGSNSGGNADYFAGDIDEVRIWNIERTGTQIANNRNVYINSDPNLKTYYRFDQGNAGGNNTNVISDLIDYSGNCINGNLTAFALNGSTSNWVFAGNSGAPILTSTSASSVAITSATLSGSIYTSGANSVTTRGFQVSTSNCFISPTTFNETGTFNTGSYSLNATGLTRSTTYYYRAFATNGSGTSYGETQSFTTLHDVVSLDNSCGDPQRTYDYLGDYNGKPRYRLTLSSCTEFVTQSMCTGNPSWYTNIFEISWNGTSWEWLAFQGSAGCIWIGTECIDGNYYPGEPPPVVLATNSASTALPPLMGWVELNGNCMPNIISGYSCNLVDQSIAQQSVIACLGSTHEVSISSQTDAKYYLINSSDEIVDGPISGTGGTINLNTGSLSATETFKVYSHSIIDSIGCNLELTDQVSITVTDPASYTLNLNSVASKTHADCGLNNGSLSFNLTQGVTPYTWTWNNSNNTNSQTGLAPGMYVVDVEDACGKTANTIQFIKTNGTSFTFNNTTTDETCVDLENGTATANVSSGNNGVVSYTWYNLSGTQIGSQASVTNLAPDMYAVVAIDANGCSDNTAIIIAEETIAMQPTISNPVSASRCGTGSVDLTVTPSSGTINWFTDAAGGSSIGSGATWTTPSISITTTYYAEAIDGVCVSSREPVLARIHVNSLPTGLTTSNISLASVDLSWTHPGAENMQIQYRKAGNSYWQEITEVYADNYNLVHFLGQFTPATDYEWRIRVSCGGTYGAYSAVQSFSTPCKAAGSLTASDISLSNVTLDWSHPGGDNMLIEYRKVGNSKWQTTGEIAYSKPYVLIPALGNFAEATDYEWRVRVKCGSDWGSYSGVATFSSPCKTPVSLNASNISSDNATVTFSHPGGDNMLIEYRKQGNSKWQTSGEISYSNNYVLYPFFNSGNQFPVSTTFEYRVRVKCGTIWGDYSSIETFATPAGPSMKVQNSDNALSIAPEKMAGILETYPNPNNGNFTVRSPEECTVKIVNELGQQVQEIEINKENNYQIEVEGLHRGVYFVSGSIFNKVSISKIVVQ